ncbi:MAG: cysteine desulfurase family protein [Lactobacillus sp.]|nr:cysteine desulfurase family protein [Lactobacillus sp.]
MIYFDNSATTKINPEVLATYNKVATDIWGNPSSLHALGDRAHQLLESAREQVAKLLGVKASEIFFTSGGTESNNTAIKGAAYSKQTFGKHIITTQIEHASVGQAFSELEDDGFEVTRLPVDKDGFVSPESLKKAIRKDTILVSIMAVNNEIGSIQPIHEFSKILADHPNILFHVDTVQAIGKGIWDQVMDPRVDMFSLSSHKFHGPRGVGILYKKVSKQIWPLHNGGGQETGLRSGTENLPAIAAMAKALRLTLENELADSQRERAVKEHILEGVRDLPGITIFSPANDHFAPHILCLALKGIRGETLVHTLEQDEIYVSTTSACHSKTFKEAGTLMAMNIPEAIATGAIRLSFDAENTLAEADQFLVAFKKLYDHFAKINHLGDK